ncbi:protein of unknown function DUF336 [Sulfobacillus acidophilus TPY]|uniref:Cobalamin adenosyltransferase n=1 Tax=Sulfobacillus acidophilus (strain ATCC 700253 / DSM 10332 / NAL) TaxID=679936 RepID=G8U0B0_SULAD|nr:protein of unknown function DUF336 [Sulfobacillus acidophilus TPY]AEW06452.1 protein of unknown function DUF336 [Sulfobacillus acidophilus DSM 10332]
MEPNALIRSMYQLTAEAADLMIHSCRKAAEALGVAVNIAVVDDAGHLIAFFRMDGAPILSIEIAQNKAYTAVAFGKPTAEWYPMIADEPALLHGIVHTPRLVIFAGGIPVRIGTWTVGAVGVSGGTADQDAAIAEAGVRALQDLVGRIG